MWLTVIFITAAVIGIIAVKAALRFLSSGALHIVGSNLQPEDPVLFLELARTPDFLANKKYVILKINVINFTPRK